ncbi:MAG TPA: 4-hydroxy-tetrahydrodipicolinate reductase [Bacteroidota bacterium]|nr:4-hydroxy-tetrahydrodipicolinate reductase [Bacteroidota bacterium]
MHLALIGYGRMGHEVELVAKEKGMKIAKTFEIGENRHGSALTKSALKGVDVCIDFSSPESAFENITAVAEAGVNIVVGTTGWHDRLEEVRALVKKKGIGCLYASNFSLGVNIFLQIVMDASHLLDAYSDYDVAVSEVHHRGKSDSPSGTALSLGSTILKELRRKNEILSETSHGVIKPNQLHVSSMRLGNTTGKHSVIFDSEADTIELVHTAKNRRGFALGAIVAAEWLKGKKGMYTMRDVLHP